MYGWEQCRQQRYELVMGEMSVQIILMAILPIVALISSTIRHVLLARVPMKASQFNAYFKFTNIDKYSSRKRNNIIVRFECTARN